MIYLKPIVRKITKDPEMRAKADSMKSDRELLNFLLSISSQEEIEKAFSHHYGIRYKKLSYEDGDKDLLKEFNKDFLDKHVIFPYSLEDGKWFISVSNITDRSTQEKLKEMFAQKEQTVEFTFSFNFEIVDVYDKMKNASSKEFVVNEEESYDAISWVQMVINNGLKMGSSDIHIEREEEGLKVRYRVDGIMTNSHLFKLTSNEISNIYVRLKIIGNMNISEKRRSQDGRIDHYEYNSKMYSLRVSTVNTINGEKFVMRVFSEDENTLNFDDLGFTKKQKDTVVKMINHSNGIIYLAGATGSGKTTTLYAMIDNLDVESLNVYTIENPVEKSIDSVNQIQIDEASGNDYPSVLKTLLRQDPDVMAVGEIRERETAEIAVQASLTGHLVLTTIHANSALDSISRLAEIGIENYLIGASSVGFISQRLARRLCPHCKKKVDTLHEYESKWIEGEIADFDYEVYKENGHCFYEPVGCDHCVNGYKGRIAIIEIIEVDEEIKSLIAKNVESKEIKEYLETTEYKTMKFDAISKALDGVTSIQEVMAKLQG